MSPNRYAFISGANVVVQVIIGDLDADMIAKMLTTYRVFFGAESVVEIKDETIAVWIGGSYDSTSGVFSPPPSPEPEVVPEEIVPE